MRARWAAELRREAPRWGDRVRICKGKLDKGLTERRRDKSEDEIVDAEDGERRTGKRRMNSRSSAGISVERGAGAEFDKESDGEGLCECDAVVENDEDEGWRTEEDMVPGLAREEEEEAIFRPWWWDGTSGTSVSSADIRRNCLA